MRIYKDRLAVDMFPPGNAHDDVGQVVVGIGDVGAHKYHVDRTACLFPVHLITQNSNPVNALPMMGVNHAAIGFACTENSNSEWDIVYVQMHSSVGSGRKPHSIFLGVEVC